MKKKARIGIRDMIGLGLSAFFLWLTLRNFSFDWRATSWNTSMLFFISVSVLLTVAPTYFNALRFKLFFRKDFKSKNIRPFTSFYIGHFYNAVLPGNIGEVVKIYHLSRKYNINHKDVLSFWVCEKFMDALLLPLMFVWAMFALDDIYIRLTGSVLSLLVFVAIFYAIIGHRYKWVAILPFRFIPIGKLRRYLYSLYIRFDASISYFWKSRLFFLFMVVSFSFYILVMLLNYTTMRAVDLPVQFLSFEALALIGGITIITHFIPSAPSSVGVLHYGIYMSLVLLAKHYGIAIDTELNNKFVLASIFFHLIFLVSDVSVGSYFVIAERKWLFGKKNG